MNDDAAHIIRMNTAPPLPQDLPPLASMLIATYRMHLRYHVDQVLATNPAYVDGVQIEILDEMALNAFAYADPHHECIGINAGLALLIPALFSYLLSHPDVFPDIGDPKQERTPEPVDPSVLRLRGRFSELADQIAPLVMSEPVDPVRRHFAAYATMLGWDFLLLHEVAQINRCHRAYRASKSSSAQKPALWLEFGADPLSVEEADLRSTLETDADGMAGRILSGAPRLNGLEKARWLAFGDSAASPWNWRQAYKAWLRPVGLLFQFMAIAENSASLATPRRTHPHPDIRMQVLVNSIWPTWEILISDRNDFIELTREGSREMQEIVRRGILPLLSSRTDDAYANDFKPTVLYRWEAMQRCAPELNRLTEERWARKRSSLPHNP